LGNGGKEKRTRGPTGAPVTEGWKHFCDYVKGKEKKKLGVRIKPQMKTSDGTEGVPEISEEAIP